MSRIKLAFDSDSNEKSFKVRLSSRTGGPVKFKSYKAESAEEAERMAIKEHTKGHSHRVMKGETVQEDAAKGKI